MRMPRAVVDQWRVIGCSSPEALGEACAQLQRAARLVTALTTAGRERFAHGPTASLGWVARHAALVGEPCARGLWAGVRPATLELILLDVHDAPVASRALDGLDMHEAIDWLCRMAQGALGFVCDRTGGLPLEPRPDDDAPFRLADPGAFAELATWYANAHALLGRTADHVPAASAVRCWPGGLSLETRIVLEGEERRVERMACVGASPGDAEVGGPYLYALGCPVPAGFDPPAVDGGGHWHHGRWRGAVLPLHRFRGDGSAAAQVSRAAAWQASALRALDVPTV